VGSLSTPAAAIRFFSRPPWRRPRRQQKRRCYAKAGQVCSVADPKGQQTPWPANTSRPTAVLQSVDHKTASHPAPHSRRRLHGYDLAEPIISGIYAENARPTLNSIEHMNMI